MYWRGIRRETRTWTYSNRTAGPSLKWGEASHYPRPFIRMPSGSKSWPIVAVASSICRAMSSLHADAGLQRFTAVSESHGFPDTVTEGAGGRLTYNPAIQINRLVPRSFLYPADRLARFLPVANRVRPNIGSSASDCENAEGPGPGQQNAMSCLMSARYVPAGSRRLHPYSQGDRGLCIP